MMNVSDIMQLVALCAALFIPLGYFAHRWQPQVTAFLRLMLCKPRYVKPAGTLHRPSTRAEHQDD